MTKVVWSTCGNNPEGTRKTHPQLGWVRLGNTQWSPQVPTWSTARTVSLSLGSTTSKVALPGEEAPLLPKLRRASSRDATPIPHEALFSGAECRSAS